MNQFQAPGGPDMSLAQYMQMMYPINNIAQQQEMVQQPSSFIAPYDQNITGLPPSKGKISGIIHSYTGGLLNGQVDQTLQGSKIPLTQPQQNVDSPAFPQQQNMPGQNQLQQNPDLNDPYNLSFGPMYS